MRLGKSQRDHAGGARVGRPLADVPPPAAVQANQAVSQSLAALQAAGLIPEANIVFDPANGHNHDGGNSSPIALAGDAQGTNAAVSVVKILGHAVGAPTDQYLLYYDQTTGQLLWTARPRGWSLAEITKTTPIGSAYTPIATDDFILCDSSGGQVGINLPAASARPNKVYLFKQIGLGGVLISRAGSDTIEGANSVTLTNPYDAAALLSDGVSTWYRLPGSK